MSTDGKTKAELVPIFKGLIESNNSKDGNAAFVLFFEIMCDIRDGLIKDEVIVTGEPLNNIHLCKHADKSS